MQKERELKNPVWELLRHRKYEESKPWNRTDGQKLGVVIEDGCSHILVLLATPLDYIPRNLNPLEKYLSLRYLRQFNPEIADYYANVRERFRQTMQFLKEKQMAYDGPPYVAVLTLPKGTKRLFTFEIREKVLLGMAQKAREVARQTLRN